MNIKEFAFEEPLQEIIDEYKGEDKDMPLEGDEIVRLAGHIKNKLYLMEGNITQEEYIKLEEK